MLLILNEAEKFFLQPLYRSDSGRKETKKAFEMRMKWKELNFPPLYVLAEKTGYNQRTIENYSRLFGWFDTKFEYFRLIEKANAEKKQKEIENMENEYGKIWESIRNSFKERVSDLNDTIDKSIDDIELKTVFKEYNDLIKNLEQIQKNERINLHLPNNYKETENIKMEQSGNLDINFSEETVNLFNKIKKMREEDEI